MIENIGHPRTGIMPEALENTLHCDIFLHYKLSLIDDQALKRGYKVGRVIVGNITREILTLSVTVELRPRGL